MTTKKTSIYTANTSWKSDLTKISICQISIGEQLRNPLQ